MMRASFPQFLALLASLLALLVTGCDRSPPPPIREITSIHMPGFYAEAARVLAKEYEQQTGIRVKILSAGLFSLREKELTDLLTRGGNYDVMQVAYQWEGEILPHLLQLDEVVDKIAPDLDDFIPTVRTNCGQWNGRTYGLPMACDVITLLYRTDVFAARSEEFQRLTGRPLTPPRTWPEYLEIAKFLNSETLYGNIVMGQEQTYTIWSGVLFGMGGRLVDEQWRPALNSETGVRSLELFTQLYQSAPPNSEGRSVGDNDILFLQGRGAMYMAWPSLIWSQLTDTNRCKIAGRIGAAVIPGARPQLSAWSLGINPACQDLDAAYGWIKFFVSRANAKRLMLEYGIGSPRLSTYADVECRQKIFYLAPVLDGLAGNQQRLRISPSQELSDYLDHELVKAIRGQNPPQAALDRTASRWREVLIQHEFLQPDSP